MFPEHLKIEAQRLLADMRAGGCRLVTAESCTGGLLAALLTEVPGASDVFERGFVTYSNDAKVEMIGVRAELIAKHGAVSREVALAMAAGALVHSEADIAVAVTGLAGPGGGAPDKPIGLIHIAAERIGTAPLHQECRFGPLGRSEIRLAAVDAALRLVRHALTRSER